MNEQKIQLAVFGVIGILGLLVLCICKVLTLLK